MLGRGEQKKRKKILNVENIEQSWNFFLPQVFAPLESRIYDEVLIVPRNTSERVEKASVSLLPQRRLRRSRREARNADGVGILDIIYFEAGYMAVAIELGHCSVILVAFFV